LIGQVRFSEAVEVACSLAREKGFVDSLEQDVVTCHNKVPLTFKFQVYIALSQTLGDGDGERDFQTNLTNLIVAACFVILEPC